MQEAMTFKSPAGQINKNNTRVASEQEQDPSVFCINCVMAGEMLTYPLCVELCYSYVIFP